MRCCYREKIIEHGDYLDVDIYPVFSEKTVKGGRRKKANPTSEVQQMLNERYAKRRVVYLLNTNFTERDYALHLTYDNAHLPEDFEDAEKQERNFIRRLKRALKKKGIELKYFAATEESSRKKRLHHHLVISGGLSVKELADLWGKGFIQATPLQFNEFGITELAYYITKETNGRKHIIHSRNLKNPTQRKRDSRISKKKIKELVTGSLDEKELCRNLYPGYELADAEPYYNDLNGNYYVALRLYKHDIFLKRKRSRQ